MSTAELFARLNTVLWSFQTLVLPICFVLGNVGNTLNLLIFSRRSSRRHSCLLYFFSASLIDIVILNFGLGLRIPRGIWNIDPGAQSVWFCRGRTYLINSAFSIYRCSILLACLDRMCASSRHLRLRQISEKRIARRLIAINWIFHFLYYIPSWIFPTIVFGQCLSPSNTVYATFLTVQTLLQGLLIPSLMIACGLITVLHLKQMQTRVGPAMSANARDERTVIGQFLTMLFIQVLTDFMCNVLYPAYLIYTLLRPGPTTPVTSFLQNMSFNLPFLNYSIGFYLYTLSSRSFRQKLFRRFRRMPTEANNLQQIGMTTVRHLS